jgi:hypothetical protein
VFGLRKKATLLGFVAFLEPFITPLLVFSRLPSHFYCGGFKFLFCYVVGTYFCTFHHFFCFISCVCYRLASIVCIMGFEKGNNLFFWGFSTLLVLAIAFMVQFLRL